MNKYFSRLAGIVVITIVTSLSPAIAQDYPTRLIHLVVPYSPGGSTDFVARLYAKKLSEQTGQPVVVDNRPGASTNIGSDVVARSTPDGYTLLFSDGAYIWNSVFGPMPPFDALTGLTPVGLVANTPFVVAANPKTKFSTMKELIAAAKSAPGKYTISSASLRTFVELMNSRAGMKLLHVPYKGGAAATTDAIAGQVNMVYAALPVLLPFIQSGKLKALGVTSLKRSPALASVPSLSEIGVNYDISIQYVVFAPANTPASIQARLAQATKKVTSDKDFSKKLLVAGSEAVSMPPAELRAKVRGELTMWQHVAKDLPDLVDADLRKPK
ncbi:Bug family tripartite tricarboxylate transporter substrate binding protein [Paralcaligenes ureilyticus]|uniref:Tripartite-type tricarboxylate transporter receptor subunit TctC n=1 Tax=Paralcaligenes ureilyticus TaxID=627131 RepID=A0A4V2UYT0_9BURK|nr:tripartite tricarboxylate transporter substrate-binding protein [Paralcaligenes ureilyticus]TCT08588.1 tripartite-type tricarboxylate transporter receptor subunit TctC [Paralcaligenes ureilyticus]